MSKKKGGLMKQKEFKEMCIRIGLVDDNLKINYHAVAVLMSLGNWYMYYQHLSVKKLYKERLDIIHEYTDKEM